ncbi:TadE/TadG family type IV pilus assembly protein [Streptomyces sp. NPDC050844]|uniref:TadE/TadG family type IV pilus assembly protein n=1 Tax=Streptomyces sp. NPDC050844 TaxID=3155790 RepID=UPI0033F891F0
MTTSTRAARARDDRGSASVELVLVTPLLVLLMLVVVALGRLVDARLVVADAAHQAARAASLARTESDAHAEARRSATTALRAAGATCARLKVAVATGGLQPGHSASVQVTCVADLGGLTRTGMPGTVSVASTAYSPIDTFRSAP